jgi:hypothetical protein
MNYLLNMRSYRLKLTQMELQLRLRQTRCTIEEVRDTRRRKQKQVWVRPWLSRRIEYGQYSKLLEELRLEDELAFRNFLRMDPRMFNELLQKVEHRISKMDTGYRKALEPGLKLAVTLRYLASGDNYHSLMYGFRVAHNSISSFIPEVNTYIFMSDALLSHHVHGTIYFSLIFSS